jgi:hypothetical protein
MDVLLTSKVLADPVWREILGLLREGPRIISRGSAR